MTFVPNPNLDREIDRMPGMVAAKMVAAREVKVVADRAIAAIGKPPLHSWMTKRRGSPLEVRSFGTDVSLITHDSAWHLYEYGSVNSVGVRPFARGVRGAGLRFRDFRKTL